VAEQAAAHLKGLLGPMGARGSDGRYNLDGYVGFATAGEGPVCHAYTQFFRSGAVEAVDSEALPARRGNVAMPADLVERRVLLAVYNALRLFRTLEVEPTIVVMVSLLGVKVMYIPAGPGGEFRSQFDRDTLLLPDCLVEHLSVDQDQLLRPVFDAMWQASGWMRSFYYDDHGKRFG
jgi:hypothetical protein